MSLESFIGLDQGEGMSESAFEAFKQRMQAAAAQIAAIKKEESKQKQSEEELLRILLAFIKDSQKTDLVLLISRALEQNIPANFILAIILLSNEDIKRQVGERFYQLISAAGGQDQAPSHLLHAGNPSTQSASPEDGSSLVFFTGHDSSFPLKMRIELDSWIKNMMLIAEQSPQKLIKTAYKIEMIELPKEYDYEEPKYEQSRSVKAALSQLAAFILREYFEQHSQEEDYNNLFTFSEFILSGILTKTEENLDNRKLLQ